MYTPRKRFGYLYKENENFFSEVSFLQQLIILHKGYTQQP